jgi:hypothetical protein
MAAAETRRTSFETNKKWCVSGESEQSRLADPSEYLHYSPSIAGVVSSSTPAAVVETAVLNAYGMEPI